MQDEKCDAALPLETILAPNPSLRKLLSDIDPKKARIIGLTNAYKTVSFDHFPLLTRLVLTLDLCSTVCGCSRS